MGLSARMASLALSIGSMSFLNRREEPLDVDPDEGDGSTPPERSCSCRRASALPLLTLKASGSAAPSGTSTQRPPTWLPVVAGTQTLCFPFFWPALACAAGTGFRSHLSCVGC